MSGLILSREQFDAEQAANLVERARLDCAAAGHLPAQASPDVLREGVPFSIRCGCGDYSWLPVRREAS